MRWASSGQQGPTWFCSSPAQIQLPHPWDLAVGHSSMWCGPHRGQARENPQISAPPTPAWSILPPVLERQLGVLGAAPPRRWCRGHCVSVPLLSFWATGSVITLYHFLGNGFLSLSETLPILFWALFFCHLPIPQSPTPPSPSLVIPSLGG